MMERCSGRYREAAIIRRERRRKSIESVSLSQRFSLLERRRGEKGACGALKCWNGALYGGNTLKMNFSVGVSMYSEKVTSYWYRLRWNQRSMVDGYSIAARRRTEAEDSRTRVAKEVVSIIGKQRWAVNKGSAETVSS